MYDGTCLPHGGREAREEKEAGVLRSPSRVCFPEASLPPNGEDLLRELCMWRSNCEHRVLVGYSKFKIYKYSIEVRNISLNF